MWKRNSISSQNYQSGSVYFFLILDTKAPPGLFNFLNSCHSRHTREATSSSKSHKCRFSRSYVRPTKSCTFPRKPITSSHACPSHSLRHTHITQTKHSQGRQNSIYFGDASGNVAPDVAQTGEKKNSLHTITRQWHTAEIEYLYRKNVIYF